MAGKTKENHTSSTEGREIISKRLFNAPIGKVWDAWADPKKLAQWWGPNGFKNHFKTFTMNDGGLWEFIMEGPDGKKYPNRITFSSVIKYKKIIFDHMNGPCFHVEVTFEDLGKQTVIIFHASFPTSKELDTVKGFAVESNEQNFDRLEHVLGVQPVNFMTYRTFAASRDRVWQAFTNPEKLKHWWGPKDCVVEIQGFELKPGGKFHFSMAYPNGQKAFGVFVYHLIMPNVKITFTNSFADNKANPVRAFFNNDFPIEVFNTWTLLEADGKTTLTVRSHPLNANAVEQKFFENMHHSMQQGFAGTFDQLERYLKKLNNN